MNGGSAFADTRIGVTVLTGFLGSGKTTLLNRMVLTPRFARAAVVINEFGAVGVDHHLVRHVGDNVRVIEGGCICCMVRGGVADTLRDLFLLALRRAIPPFRELLIETSGLASPAPILFTLRHEAFLAERYVYNGTIAVADALHIEAQLDAGPEAPQQLALADEIVISKIDLASPEQAEHAMRVATHANPVAHVHVLPPDEALPHALLTQRLYRRPQAAEKEIRPWLAPYTGLSPRAMGQLPHSRHARDVAVATVVLPAVRRGAFLRAMAAMQAELGDTLLRVKGLVAFEGDDRLYAVHGVHAELYPMVPLAGRPEGESDSRLVFIARGIADEALDARVRHHLLG